MSARKARRQDVSGAPVSDAVSRQGVSRQVESRRGETRLGLVESLFGRGSALSGDFSCEGFLRLEGDCRGNLKVGRSLIIAEGASFSGEAVAETIVVAGTVRSGRLIAKGSITILASARVSADLESRSLSVEEGAFASGNVIKRLD